MFSDPAGYSQYIQFQELSGLNDQQHLAGLTLQVTSRDGSVKRFTFPGDLPSSATRTVPCLSEPCTRVLPTSITPSLPAFCRQMAVPCSLRAWIHGPSASCRPMVTRPCCAAGPQPRIRQIGSLSPVPPPRSSRTDPVIEYYNRSLDHYFMTGKQPELDVLDTGRLPGWYRTGELFPAWEDQQCRLRASRRRSQSGSGLPLHDIPPASGDSHFYSASSAECQIAPVMFPSFVLETNSGFLASVPNPTSGTCNFAQIPVYRVWNGRFDSNHRYTTSLAIRDLMFEQGLCQGRRRTRCGGNVCRRRQVIYLAMATRATSP